MIHFHRTFCCQGCGLEQNHAWLCVDCGCLIPADCGEDDKCAKGYSINELAWGRLVEDTVTPCLSQEPWELIMGNKLPLDRRSAFVR